MAEEVTALYRKVFGDEHPETLKAMNALVRTLATCADATFRDPERTVELAAQAAKLDSQNAYYVGTLGTAQYRAGDFAAAIAGLETALRLGKEDGDESQASGFFLAMARWQTGDREQAPKDYAQAVAAMEMEKNGADDEENLRFQKEARAPLMADE